MSAPSVKIDPWPDIKNLKSAFLVLVAADDAFHVGLALFLFLEEGVFVVARRNLRRVVAEIDHLLVLGDGRFGAGLLDFLQTDDFGRLLDRPRLDLFHLARRRGLRAFAAAARRRRRQLIGGLADGAGNGRTVQIVKPRSTARANALGPPYGFRHRSSSMMGLRMGTPLPRRICAVKSY